MVSISEFLAKKSLNWVGFTASLKTGKAQKNR